MADLKLTLVQTSLLWEKPEANRNHFDLVLKSFKKGSSNLIVLPEMFTTGFTMNAEGVAEKMDGPTVAWMAALAAKKNAVVCGSLVISEKKKYFNRLIWMQPDGKYSFYDKRHLFRMAGEHNIYASGTKKLEVELQGWNICPLICYDLRFPVWSRSNGDFDLMIYIANWPKQRSFAWNQLLVARAIENQCYVAGLNRIGRDGKQNEYSGDSVVLDAYGQKISSTKPTNSSVETVVLSLKKLKDFRKSFPVFMDADKFKIQ